MNFYSELANTQIKELKEKYFYLVSYCEGLLEFVEFLRAEEHVKLSEKEREEIKDLYIDLLNFYDYINDIDVRL